MSKRVNVVAGLLCALVLTSGCIGFITGQEALELEADRAMVEESAVADTDYELNSSDAQVVERNLTFAGVSRQVRVTNYVTTYDKNVAIPLVGDLRLAMFGVISTPAVELAGEARNPIGDYSNDQLVEVFASRYEGLSNTRQVGSRNVTVLGTETRVTKYEATTTVQGQQVDVYVHVTKFRHESDYVIAVGVYPKLLDGEEQNVYDLIRALEHPA